MKASLSFLLLVLCFSASAQSDEKKALQFSGYAEAYYSYDFSNPSGHDKAFFTYNHKRHNEFNVNLAYAKAAYQQNKVRANLALMVGNYVQYNLASEPTWAQFVYEANVGVKLSSKKSIWLDAGIMPSHIGFESAVGADCWTLSRSMLAENSPYYEAGLKLSYQNNRQNLLLSFLILNGWQHIRRLEGIQRPNFGVQVNYKPTDKLMLNYSNYIGTDKPTDLDVWRTYHNFYLTYEPSARLGWTAGFDIGTDQYKVAEYGIWYTPVLIGRYSFHNKHKIAARLEYFNDKNEIIIPTNTQNGFQTWGFSLNYDYQIQENALFRAEFKNYTSKDAIFIHQNQSARFNNVTTVALCIRL